MAHFWLLTALADRMDSIQSVLNFDGWKCGNYPQFDTAKGLGRVAFVASILGIILGVHLLACFQLVLLRVGLLSIQVFGNWPDEVLLMALQWTVYIVMLCSFHMGEFFTTALCNPTVVSSDSFMVNHSKAYTTAALISWAEFFVRLYFLPQINSVGIFGIGIFFVLGGQICRTWAMITCGESFNHYIQRDKKDNHILVTHGIYGFLRHPSYVGFFYWAVGTQLILCNPLSVALYTVASWTFFRHRIVYEEATLREHFPGAYESYAEKTFIGIPLINAFVSQ